MANDVANKTQKAVNPTPHRVQRKRTKGFRLPPNTVCVTRPGRWGNPFRIGMEAFEAREACSKFFRYALDIDDGVQTRERAVSLFREVLTEYGDKVIDDLRRELRGKNLACYCALDKPCHADVLLEIANSDATEPSHAQ